MIVVVTPVDVYYARLRAAQRTTTTAGHSTQPTTHGKETGGAAARDRGGAVIVHSAVAVIRAVGFLLLLLPRFSVGSQDYRRCVRTTSRVVASSLFCLTVIVC